MGSVLVIHIERQFFNKATLLGGLQTSDCWVQRSTQSHGGRVSEGLVGIRLSEVERVLNDDEDEFFFRRDENLVLPTSQSQVGQLVRRVQVPDDGVGPFRKLRDHDRVLGREGALEGGPHHDSCQKVSRVQNPSPLKKREGVEWKISSPSATFNSFTILRVSSQCVICLRRSPNQPLTCLLRLRMSDYPNVQAVQDKKHLHFLNAVKM